MHSHPSSTPAAAAPVRGAELLLLALVLIVGGYLRLSHLDLLEFQGDQATASQLALDLYEHGTVATAGLMSSVGVTNPPLFVYLLMPLVAVSANPVVITVWIAVLSLAAVAAVWHVGRVYHGPIAGLSAALFFAVSPWAVLYSRNIWAQDFIPLFSTATLWAVHSLILGRKPKVIFWVVLLPLWSAQIHFSGLALTAAVGVIVIALRPRMDRRFAAAGLVVAMLPLVPYLKYQRDSGWSDLRNAESTLAGTQPWGGLHGLTISPISGYRLPIHASVDYAVAILNTGHIEDCLGLATDPGFDPARRWASKSDPVRPYFSQTLTLPAVPLVVERGAFVVALLWLGTGAIRGTRWRRIDDPHAQRGYVLVLWFMIPLLVFLVAHLWTYLTYYVIFYPAHFLVLGIAAEKIAGRESWRLPVVGAIFALGACNVVFMVDFYRFTQLYGGVQGTFGSGLGYKQAAAEFLAQQGGQSLQEECQLELAHATRRDPSTATAPAQPQLWQLDHLGGLALPELEYAYLVTHATPGRGTIPPTVMILIVDTNREAFSREIWQKLSGAAHKDFGPIHLYLVKR